MATREENLKKINDELEKLSDDELDEVAGGFLQRPPRNLPHLIGKSRAALQNQAQADIAPDEAKIL